MGHQIAGFSGFIPFEPDTEWTDVAIAGLVGSTLEVFWSGGSPQLARVTRAERKGEGIEFTVERLESHPGPG